MSLRVVLAVNASLRRYLRSQFGQRYLASLASGKSEKSEKSGKSSSDIEADETPIFAEDDDAQLREEEITKKRNKSKLYDSHRNMLHGVKPYEECQVWYHDTVKYKRRMLGRYGIEAAGVPAGIAWPTIEELEDMKEYERVAYPVSLENAWARIAEKNRADAERIRAREADVSAKLLKMEKWKTELQERIEKKREAMEVAKAHKEKLVEEIRQHFGFKIDTHDVRFKEMLEKKEKEAKKMKKEQKQKLKEEKLRQRLEALNAEQFGTKANEGSPSSANRPTEPQTSPGK